MGHASRIFATASQLDDSSTGIAGVGALPLDGVKRAEAQAQQAREQQQRADDLYLENLRLQVELGRLKKWYYGPRADRL